MKKIKKSKKINEKIVTLLAVFILLFLIVFIMFMKSQSNFKIELENGDVSIHISELSKVKFESKKKNVYFGQTDTIYSYSIFKSSRQFGYIEITERTLDNGDYYIFIKSDNSKRTDADYYVNFCFKNNYDSQIIAENIVNKGFSSIVGYDKTTVPYLYLNNDTYGSMILSKVYKSNVLEKEYDNGGYSSIRELVSESNGWEKTDTNNYRIKIDSDSELTEAWMLVSKEQLLITNTEKEDYVNMYMKSSGSTPWITRIGQYDKIAYSISPFTREGYARNPGSNFGENEYSYYELYGNRIYYDFYINKLVGLYNMPRNDKGVWYTEYTSTYVSNGTNVFAPFVDTRHNENLSKFLFSIGKELNIKQLEDDSYLYLDYIVSKAKDGKVVYIVEGLFLLSDYYSDYTDSMTHASLNHQLGTANFLLEAYSRTKKQDYYDIGITIIKAIEFQNDLWIKEDGDLWYRMSKDYEFDSTDYKIVTLDDLLYIQKTLENIGKKRSSVFDKFISSKYQYLLSINYDIPSSTISMLKEQKFIK